MEKVIVSYTVNVQLFFDELIEKLFHEDYFNYEENAIDYVKKLVYYINASINNLPHKLTPKSLSKHGDFYIFYNSNARTTWYIFFTKKNSNYLIKHIANNHTFDATFINELNKND